MAKQEKRKELKVSAIENGTVIDHIPPQSVFQVINILRLSNIEHMIMVGTNLESKKHGKKGVIKISNKYFESEEINKIALVAPTATLIVIKDYTVVYKAQVEIPEHIHRIVKCINPNCVTNAENIPTKFTVLDREDLRLHCTYCEKYTKKENFKFI
ncbi:MAG: aspartate carbamoyltransferase regulatory subunit [Bacteroidales bacterium]|nr:aspartate carbamoyltransferase regulatory subunit [Bacteroidales bacterium]MCF8405682.1 aspartate carbamoyltransferase regulatory subunit [Bacteroidales bacterium]